MDVNKVREWYLAVGEWFDAWRIIPRVLVAGYAYMFYTIVQWYKDLRPYMLENCVSENVVDCIVQAPTTQHTALITAVVSIAAAIFGLYATSGRKWENGMKKWGKEKSDTTDSASE